MNNQDSSLNKSLRSGTIRNENPVIKKRKGKDNSASKMSTTDGSDKPKQVFTREEVKNLLGREVANPETLLVAILLMYPSLELLARRDKNVKIPLFSQLQSGVGREEKDFRHNDRNSQSGSNQNYSKGFNREDSRNGVDSPRKANYFKPKYNNSGQNRNYSNNGNNNNQQGPSNFKGPRNEKFRQPHNRFQKQNNNQGDDNKASEYRKAKSLERCLKCGGYGHAIDKCPTKVGMAMGIMLDGKYVQCVQEPQDSKPKVTETTKTVRPSDTDSDEAEDLN
jgi:hypothetical protein